MLPYMVGKLAPNSSQSTRGLFKYVPDRGYFCAVFSQNGDKFVTSPPPPPIVERVKTVFGGRGHDCIPQNFSNVHGCSKHTVIYSLVVGNFEQELRVLGDISVRKKTKE